MTQDEIVLLVMHCAEEEQEGCLEKAKDARLRVVNLKKHADIIDWYFYQWIQALLKHVLPMIGAEDWIIRYEVQTRKTIYAHLLVRVRNGLSNKELKMPPSEDEDNETKMPTKSPAEFTKTWRRLSLNLKNEWWISQQRC